MNKTKNSGITLVALVITVIILLILAGITISQLTGSGLFENAKLAEEKSKEAQEKEDSILGDYENKIGLYLEGGRALKESELISNIKLKLGDIEGTKAVVGADITAKNDSDIWEFLVFVNGEIKGGTRKKDENVTISNLQPNTEYMVFVMAIDKYGNIRKSNEEKIKTNYLLEYSVITSTGIYNYGRDNQYVLDLEVTNSPYASNALLTAAYDNNTSTSVKGNTNDGFSESYFRYLNVDFSAIGKKVEVTLTRTSTAYCYGYVYTVAADGTKTQVVGGTNSTYNFTIPEGCKQIGIIMQSNCYLTEMKVVE